MRSRPVVTAAFLGVLLAVGGVAFLRSPESSPDEGDSVDGFERLVPALCQARDNARTDTGDSRRIFLDEVHAPLHSLADEVAASDRAAAAELLEAKQAVEADLEEEAIETRDLERDLDTLIGATIAAADVLGMEVGSCA